MTSKFHKLPILWFSALMLSTPLLFLLFSRVTFDNSILSLLPATEQDPLVDKGVKHFTEKVSSRSLFLIGHNNFDKAAQAADKFVGTLKEQSIFQEIDYKAEENTGKQWYEIIFPHRYHMLTTEGSNLLRSGHEEFFKDRIKKLYSPVSSLYSPNLENDPLMLFGDYLRQIPSTGNVQIKNNYLTIEHKDINYILISTRFSAQVFDSKTQELIRATLDKAVGSIGDATFLQSSFFPYAERGRKQAEWEITVIGGGSTLGIALLFLIVFRSLRQLTFTMISIGTGVIWGIVSTQLIFGSIHLFTLVFGASLIGVCVDYSFHFFAKRLYLGKNWQSFEGLRLIFPGILLGAITSILAYGALLSADFPGLQQLASFACIGLAVSFIVVVLYFPIVFKSPPKRGFKPHKLVKAYAGLWSNFSKTKTSLIFAAILTISFIGIFTHKTNDDVRLLQPRPVDLVQQEKKVYEILRSVDNSRFLLIKANSPEQLLLNEEEVSTNLDKLVKSEKLHSYFCISRILPSKKVQTENHQLLLSKITPDNLKAYADELEFEKDIMQKCLTDLKSSKPLSLEAFLKSPASRPVQSLYIGKIDNTYMSIILLEGIKSIDGISNIPKSAYVDRINSFSKTFKKYRVKATWITIIAYGAIMLLLCIKFDFKKAWAILLPPIFAALLSCATISLLGIPLNLFNILSLLVVLGIGIDYSIFFALSSSEHHRATGLAILLSAVSTILAFGLLSLSATASVKTFGLTLLFGIIYSVLLAPLAKVKE